MDDQFQELDKQPLVNIGKESFMKNAKSKMSGMGNMVQLKSKQTVTFNKQLGYSTDLKANNSVGSSKVSFALSKTSRMGIPYKLRPGIVGIEEQ